MLIVADDTSQHLKAMRYQGGANGSTEKIHIFVLSDVVLVAQRRFRDSKLTVSDCKRIRFCV